MEPQTHSNTKTYIIIGALIVVIAAALLLKGKFGGGAAPTDTSLATTTAADDQITQENAAEALVTNFGLQLQKVSLLDPNSASSMEEFYGPFVAPDLLKLWEQNPSSAPGRQASSPWPDHIEIGSAQAIPQGFIVRGQIVFMTSTEAASSTGNAGVQDVTITITNASGTPMITSYQAGQFGTGAAS